MPAFINSPQFLSLAISKSNLLFAFACCINAMFAAAATPLLLRVIKPIIKKTVDTVKKKLGKGKKKEEQTPEKIAKKYKMKKLVITD